MAAGAWNRTQALADQSVGRPGNVAWQINQSHNLTRSGAHRTHSIQKIEGQRSFPCSLSAMANDRIQRKRSFGAKSALNCAVNQFATSAGRKSAADFNFLNRLRRTSCHRKGMAFHLNNRSSHWNLAGPFQQESGQRRVVCRVESRFRVFGSAYRAESGRWPGNVGRQAGESNAGVSPGRRGWLSNRSIKPARGCLSRRN